MQSNIRRLDLRLLGGVAAVALMTASGAAQAQTRQFDIPAQPLSEALAKFGAQSDVTVVTTTELTRSKTSRPVQGAVEPDEALALMLEGTGLTYRRQGEVLMVVQAGEGGSGPQGAGADVDALIVTAQKREENIQDVPIAISAFSQEDLTRSQVAGGPDLMTQVPNMTFTKTNFSSYSIQIRGIGTQAISATTDAAVAVAFNNTSFIRNRFFEQEFYDLERIEVLRGPQGTLYGRNATAGAVNIISSKPKFDFQARASADVANYASTRLEGMVNIPLVEDKAALRVAGAWTKRDGFVTNEITGNPIDGRDLWSTRVSLRVAPTDGIDVNLIWEHFQEKDDRLRSGKQLCKTDEITNFAGFPTTHYQLLGDYGQDPGLLFAGVQGSFSQGCAPASLYSPESFGTPNGISLPYYLPLGAIFLPTALDDPYISRTQSHDLRVIESTVDPRYDATSDLGELQFSIDVADDLTLTSETAYLADDLFSLEDYNRFNTAPGAWGSSYRPGVMQPGPNGNIFCDPQLGCTDRLVAVDVSSAQSRQFSQELRLSSDYDGPFNFSLGANFLRYDTEDKYYVFINSLSIIASISPYANVFTQFVPGADNHECLLDGPVPPDFSHAAPVAECTYLDPNPIGSLNDQGHNYFLSRNPYKLISYAGFGEVYYNLTDNLKITAGLRLTVDKKEAPRIPSWVLASNSVGYPITEIVRQDWTEPTGRLAIDWKPDLSFTDETLLYASYAHGYKAGGANPPPTGVVCYSCGAEAQGAVTKSATHPKTFDPEFVDAFELGAKNTFLDGRLTVNTAAFYYDYKGYQISQIVNRSAVNLNFDAQVWGLEVEADWRPVENFRLGFKGGYENTKVADGMKAVDLMDRTAGNDAWTVYKPFPTFPSNCVLPKWLFIGNQSSTPANPELVNVGGRSGGGAGGCELAYVMSWDPVTDQPYSATPGGAFARTSVNYADWSTDPADYPGWPTGVPITNGMAYPGWDPTVDYGNNGGEGFDKDLSGNELPNAPHFTATVTADWSVPLPNDWLATLHGDFYYQSEAWTRIFNMEGYDKLKAYSNINLALLLNNEDAGWHVMAYVKNVLDRDSITGAFLNSDDTGLTTNIFLTEPRLYGVRVTKDFTGSSVLGSFGQRHEGPYAFTVELGGQAQRQDAPYQALRPGFAADLSPTLDAVFDTAQNQDLDWGDGRDVRLTYTPNGVWRVSAAVRFGKANSGRRYLAYEEGDRGCSFASPVCPYTSPFVFSPFIGNNYANGSVFDREEHTIVDLMVGRDVGLGMASRLSAGLRYAELKSSTQLEATGIPDWQIPATNAFFLDSQHHLEESTLLADREFSGAGPVATWEASTSLLDGGEAGRLDLEWSVEGGVLFGKQKTTVNGEETSRYFNGPQYYNYAWTRQVGPTVTTPVEESRSRSVTVPTAALSLGLSYSIDRVKVGAGYRWERYFDALDGGFNTAKDVNRTLDGPYFKLAIGFGG